MNFPKAQHLYNNEEANKSDSIKFYIYFIVAPAALSHFARGDKEMPKNFTKMHLPCLNIKNVLNKSRIFLCCVLKQEVVGNVAEVTPTAHVCVQVLSFQRC